MKQEDRVVTRRLGVIVAGVVLAVLAGCSSTNYGGSDVDSGQGSPPPPPPSSSN